ncbi:PcfB family protein [Eubacterium sp. 1001713B170207_170306_E7]|uniref:PcfB family protein n=1 Tax=Eubacterium sp. 1001713B170207_170306_E7 TaxID=2787097 RepID=UPI00189A0F87|nr:PcfB family protein [Eubacterium sp. 1001713B170207_170306_E7]
MNTSGDAAESIVRLSMEGIEAALRVTGSGAKGLAMVIIALLQSKDSIRNKGRTRLKTMLKSGKPTAVFAVKNEDLQSFMASAKKYGILYAVVRDPNGMEHDVTDVIVKSEDAGRVNRLVEKFDLNVKDIGAIVLEREREALLSAQNQEKGSNETLNPDEEAAYQKEEANAQAVVNDLFGEAPELEHPERETSPEAVVEDLFTPTEKNITKEEAATGESPGMSPETPLKAKSPRSEPSSPPDKDATIEAPTKPSVKAALNQIKADRAAQIARVAVKEALVAEKTARPSISKAGPKKNMKKNSAKKKTKGGKTR